MAEKFSGYFFVASITCVRDSTTSYLVRPLKTKFHCYNETQQLFS